MAGQNFLLLALRRIQVVERSADLRTDRRNLR
jgi:hypothetical protein